MHQASKPIKVLKVTPRWFEEAYNGEDAHSGDKYRPP
jgi:hypothetical protein